MFRRILKCDNFDWQAIRFLHLDIALEHSKKDVANASTRYRKLLHATVSAMDGCSYTFHLEELKEQKRRQKEKGGKTKNQTTENAMGQTVVAQQTNVWPV